MALPQYDSLELIKNIKRRCSVPTSQLTFTNEDFSRLADDELHDTVVPLMMSTREEYFVTFVDVPSPSDGEIEFPSEAVGSKLRSVSILSQTNPLVLTNLPRIDLDIVTGVGVSNNQSVAGFYVQGSKLMLWPNTSIPTGQTIRIYYYKRTLVLATPSTYGQVVSVDTDLNTVVLSFVPASWSVGTTVNAVSSQPNFALTNSGATIVTLSAPSVILDSVEGISIGDYVSEQGFSAVPQVPIEAHAYLAQLTAVKCLEALGDSNGMQAAQMKADQMKQSLLVMISQRVDGSVKKVIPADGGLRLNSGIRNYRRGW